MIAVIADDFTGAAEIGGLGLRYKMKVEIETGINTNCAADLLIIATDIRSKSAQEAVNDINLITAQLMKLKPDLIYKKIDSVLRGHIVAELFAQMKVSGQSKALVIPANPELGRTIKDGIYYLKGKRLHETSFRNDPEFAITSSYVMDILHNENGYNLIVAKPDAVLPADGIIIGEALTENDLHLWAERVDDRALVAGASGFFSALLEHRGFSPKDVSVDNEIAYSEKRMLFVCGSSFSTSKRIVGKALAEGAPVSLMSAALTEAPHDQLPLLNDQWAAEIVSLFTNHNYVIVAADPTTVYPSKELAKIIRKNTAMVVRKVIKEIKIEELMLEGGSTASAVLKELGLERFYPEQELAHGVIRMSIPESKTLHITLKPGSYEWPLSAWNFYRGSKNK